MDKAKVIEYLEEIFKTEDITAAKCFAKLALEEIKGNRPKTPYVVRRTDFKVQYLYRGIQQLRAATKWEVPFCKHVLSSGAGAELFFDTPEECRLFWYKLHPEIRPLFEIIYR